MGHGDPTVPNKRWVMGTGEFLGAGTPGEARLATKRHCPRQCQKPGPDIVLVLASVHTVPPPKDYLFVCLFVYLNFTGEDTKADVFSVFLLGCPR